MDYLLENQNLGLLEKNKKVFTDLSKDNIINNEPTNIIETESCKDTFKMYTDFMTEKQGLLEIIDEMVKFSMNQLTTNQHNLNTKFLSSENPLVLKSIKNQSDLINYKNRVIMILENYQEQPGLLDPILGYIIPNLMNNSLFLIESLLKNKNELTLINLQCLYQIVYILCKIRGYSTIIKFFSSEVHVFEPVITFLLSLNPMDTENWFLLYVLLLWTSILGLIPFDIVTIDTNNIITSGLFEYYKKTLNLSGVLRDISAYSLSKFLTRPDVIKNGLLENFIHYAINVLQSEQKQLNTFELLGVLSSLCEIFKNGLPGDMIKYSEIVVNKVIRFKFDVLVSNSGIFMKYLSKLSQRVGLVLLKPKFQIWRYQMKLSNLLGSKTNPADFSLPQSQQAKVGNKSQNEEDELNYEIDFELLETIIDFLLTNLSHKEYIVRWSSAKGLGRLCERLTKQMVDDILQNIFDLFENEENEYSWQGACLCLAELCKRGMILPEKLGSIVQYLEKALVFEVNKGTFCTGSSVRDSACYVVWALARAYTREVMKPFVNQIVKSLILTILFDKEVNCRRAASAAFQEHVGRQGYFPHGIEIITEADYFTLGNRAYCYLHISTFISQYPEYYQTIVDYLCFNRLIHVESNIRTISSEAIGLLVPFRPNYFVDTVLPKLIELSYSKTLHVRHGAIIGIGYILVGLSGKWDFEQKARKIRKKILEGMNSNEKKVLEDSEYRSLFENKYEMIKYNNSKYLLSDQLILEINSIPENLDTKNLYRGKGAELMRTAVNNLVRLISESNLNVNKKQINYFFDLLIDNLKHPNNEIQKEACEGLRLLNNTYSNLINEDHKFIEEIEKKFLHIIKLAVTDENIYITKGFTMSIPYFDSKLLMRNYPAAMESLFVNSKMKKTNNNDAETRKFALESLCWLSCKFIQEYPDLILNDIDKILTYMLEGLQDYEIDKKLGDVGSKVREASMVSLTNLLLILFKSSKSQEKFKQVFYFYLKNYLKGLLKQICEKMGKMRQTAGDSLQKLFIDLKDYDENEFSFYIPNYQELKIIFLDDIRYNDKDQINNVQWLEPNYSYKKIINIILYDEYSYKIFEGLITSIGGITEDTQKCSLEELDSLVDSLEEERKINLIKMIYSHIINIFQNNEKIDRVIEPLFNTLTHLLTKNVFINNLFLSEIDQIHRLVTKENYDSNNIHKVLSSVDIFYNLLFLEKEEKFNILNRCLRSLLVLMTHKYPVVRKKASEKLYIFFIGLEDPSMFDLTLDDVDTIGIILSDTNWTEGISIIRESRNTIAKMVSINLDNLVKTGGSKPTSTKTTEN